MTAPKNPKYVLEQEFAFIDGLGEWNDAWGPSEPRTECRFNPLPDQNLSRVTLLEKYAATWGIRTRDFRGAKLRASMRDTIIDHIEDRIENVKEMRRGATATSD